MAKFDKPGKPEPIIDKISQETLAAMVGTTRSRISEFMTKFRKLGWIDYNGKIEAHNSLLNIVLNDNPHLRERLDSGFGKEQAEGKPPRLALRAGDEDLNSGAAGE